MMKKTLSFLSHFLREIKLFWSRFIFGNRFLAPATPAVRHLPLTLRIGSMNANNGGNLFVFCALRMLETRICRRYRLGLLFILHASAPYTTLRRNYVYTVGNWIFVFRFHNKKPTAATLLPSQGSRTPNIIKCEMLCLTF